MQENTTPQTLAETSWQNRRPWIAAALDPAISEGPTAYQVVTLLACPHWCELPPGHDVDDEHTRVHRAVIHADERVRVELTEYANRDDAEPFSEPRIAVEVDVAAGPYGRAEAAAIAGHIQRAYARHAEIVADIQQSQE